MAAEPVMMKGGDPLLSVSWNMTYLVTQNLTPPVFPLNAAYNKKIQSLIPDDLKANLAGCFQPEAAGLQATELMMEENGPLGLGMITLFAISVVGTCLVYRGSHRAPPLCTAERRLLWLDLFIFACRLIANVDQKWIDW